jgi:5-methylcytosine-specific restriction endonuclease McrBC regulatory subunit McrC
MKDLKDNSLFEIAQLPHGYGKLKDGLTLSLGDYAARNIAVYHPARDLDRIAEKNADDLILSILPQKEGYCIQTGNYVGKIRHNGMEFEIGSRFSQVFLERMLSFANGLFLDDLKLEGDRAAGLDIARFVLFFVFTQQLEKALLLGLPKSYQSVNHREPVLRGRLDIAGIIRRDMPYVGKISSIGREQKEVQPIVDLLFRATAIIGKEQNANIFKKRLSNIHPHLKQLRSKTPVTGQTVYQAQSEKALQNPIFAPYKSVLKLAELIVKNEAVKEQKGAQETQGFLLNVAELFEVYITGLLRLHFFDWTIDSPKIQLYSSQFYSRKIIPDIVMQKEDRVAVFDTKYKRMNMIGTRQNGMGDLDRNDFFQINTYMAYYRQKGKELLGGGLIYPLSRHHDPGQCFADRWLDGEGWFAVDGIELDSAGDDMQKIKETEEAFIKRLKHLLQPKDPHATSPLHH